MSCASLCNPRNRATSGRWVVDCTLACWPTGTPDLADKLTYVFGGAHCADCGTLFQVDQAVGAAAWES
jgi:hypothetical protein